MLLSRRGDPEQWYRSMAATVLPRTRELLATGDGDPMVPLFQVLFRGLCTDIGDPDDAMSGYERWLSEVRTEIEPERLVEWQPGDGWDPICRALAMPVPDRPFPHENSTADYRARKEMRARRDEARLASLRSADRAAPG
ncbi:hypothetical protein SAMN05421678_107238 [Actinopolymorpha cephalotaxi]|uniref:Uncharacterized protein n=1 Tax=Actinopolymorpha cephalotaxi TaxID=504797 RepID=A0A1I2TT82_9ACTN|nr:hypothetical protein [Actinopolymorpha cephalotaxi]SFG65561.1 hypothetical protein SAMN05421678_107238 [Actinopolymorpha cephalotaxi]